MIKEYRKKPATIEKEMIEIAIKTDDTQKYFYLNLVKKDTSLKGKEIHCYSINGSKELFIWHYPQDGLFALMKKLFTKVLRKQRKSQNSC